MAESAVGEEGHQAAVSRGQPCALPGTVLRPPLARKKWPLLKKSKMQPVQSRPRLLGFRGWIGRRVTLS